MLTETSTAAPPSALRRRYSALATSTDAPPPNPFKSATICGMAVIWIVLARTAPTAAPMTSPIMIAEKPIMRWFSNVTTIASSMPDEASMLPFRAVAGEDSHFSPKMKRTAASRYASSTAAFTCRPLASCSS